MNNNNLFCVVKKYTVKSELNLFKGNNGLFTVSTVDEAIKYKQSHQNKLDVELLRPFVQNMMVGDYSKPWSGLYVADIDVKKYLNHTNFTQAQKEAYMDKLDKIFSDNVTKCTYLIQRSSSGLGYHIYNYFTGEIFNDNYRLVGLWVNNGLFEKIVALSKTETWLAGLVEYQNNAIDSEKVFDLHATNIKQCIRVSNKEIVYRNTDFKPFNLPTAFIEFLKGEFTESKTQTVTYKAISKGSDLITKEINPNGFITDHYQRFSFANALYSEFGNKYDKEALFEIGKKFINTTVDKNGKNGNYTGRISDFKADLETAFKNNKKASKYGMSLLKKAGLIDGFTSDAKFDLFKPNEEIILDYNQYITDVINPVLNSITNNKVTEIYAGCGFGKTYCIGKLAKDLKRPVIFLVPNTSIAFQNINELKKNEKVILQDLFGNDYEVPNKEWKIVYSGTKEKLIDINFEYNNVVCCYEAFNILLAKDPDKIPENTLLVFDEAHMIFNKGFRVQSFNIINDFVMDKFIENPDNKLKLLLLSGTPSYETVAWKPYIVNYKKNIKPQKVAIQWISQTGEKGNFIKSIRSYIYKLVKQYNNESAKYLYLYYGGTGEALNTMFNEDPVLKENTFCFYKDANKDAIKEINKNKWKLNCQYLICSNFIEAGYNLWFPGKGDAVIFANTSDEAVQALARIRNRNNLENIFIVLIGENVNYYNEGNYTPLKLDLLEKYKKQAETIVSDREAFKENQKWFDLSLSERTLDGINVNSKDIAFYIMVKQIERHNSQEAVLEYYLNNNGFVIDYSLTMPESILYYDERNTVKGKKETTFQFFDWFNYTVENGISKKDNYNCYRTSGAKAKRSVGYQLINNITKATKELPEREAYYVPLNDIVDLKEMLLYTTEFDTNCVNDFYKGFSENKNSDYPTFEHITEIISQLDHYCALVDILFRKHNLSPIKIYVELDRNLDDKCILWFTIKQLLKGTKVDKYKVYKLYKTLTKLINLSDTEKETINYQLNTLYGKSIIGYCKESDIEYYYGLDKATIEDNDFIMKTIIEIENNEADINSLKAAGGALGGALGGSYGALGGSYGALGGSCGALGGSYGAISGGSNKKTYKCVEDYCYSKLYNGKLTEFNAFKDQIYTVNDLIDAGLSDKAARKILKGDHFELNK